MDPNHYPGMDNQYNPLLNWAYFCSGKSMDELRQSLLLTALELENTRIKAEEELQIKDGELDQLREMLNRAIKERDEANEKCQSLLSEKLLLQQSLLFEKLLLQQQQQQQQKQQQQSLPASGVSSMVEDEPRRGGITMEYTSKSYSDCDESIVSSPVAAEQFELALPIVPTKPLPEKGKFLEAVMKAGPLLQTLLLAGPLPQWRHPPPPFDTQQIPPPPVVIPSPPPPPPPPPPVLPVQDHLLSFATCVNSINNCGRVNRKRGFTDDYDYSTLQAKYQRLVLH